MKRWIINPEWDNAKFAIEIQPQRSIHFGPKPNPDYVTPSNGEIVGWQWNGRTIETLRFVDGKVIAEVKRAAIPLKAADRGKALPSKAPRAKAR